MIEGKSIYKCSHCGKLLVRESTKKWITSYCEILDKVVRIQYVRTVEYPEKVKQILEEEQQ